MKVTLIHAYSSTNSGDGLLVDEAAAIVREALGGGTRLTLVALDPASFDSASFESVVHPLTGRNESMGSAKTLLNGGLALVRGALPHSLREVIRQSDLVVAVGGGYLRAKTPVEALKWLFTHAPQLPRRRDAVPFVYLPQSIGPLRFGAAALVRRRLRHAGAVFVRDDRSLSDLADLGHVRRKPDMALLGLPDEWRREFTVSAGTGAFSGLVARNLVSTPERIRRYRRNIDALRGSGLEYLAQATARGNNDVDFYRSLGFSGPVTRLRDAVVPDAARRAAVVVSVRLHGALQSIRSGVPSVHLSYERKGWGAFDDLGLSEYVHNAFDFDPDAVIRQVEALRIEPGPYWDAVENAASRLGQSRQDLVAQLQSVATGRSPQREDAHVGD
jgi:polysaccharide pyruvyl transferase WcaK-like protein